MTNRDKARQHFIDNGVWQKFNDPVMHHKDPSWKTEDLDRYNQWNPTDLEVMERGAHNILHHRLDPQVRVHRGEDNGMYDVHRYGEDNPNYGHKWSDDQKQSMSEKKTGLKSYTNGESYIMLKPTDEIPEGFIAKGHPNKHPMIGTDNPMYGKPSPNRKPIRITNLKTNEIREFPCAGCTECTEYLNYKDNSVCCNAVSQALKYKEGYLKRKTYYVEYIER